jgi:hypothetical protein
VDAVRNLLALKITAANEQERAQGGKLAAKLQDVSGGTVQIAFVDQSCTGKSAAPDTDQAGIKLTVVKHEEAKLGFVLSARR